MNPPRILPHRRAAPPFPRRLRPSSTAARLFAMGLGVALLSTLSLYAVWARATHTLNASLGTLEEQLPAIETFLSRVLGESEQGRGKPHEITVNGIRLRIQSGFVQATSVRNGARDLSYWVDQVRKDCAVPMADSDDGHVLLPTPPSLARIDEKRALVGCLKPRRTWTWNALEQLSSRFAQEGDLAIWGRFQGALIRERHRGMSVLTVEVVDGLNPSAAFPAMGQAPGGDIETLPVPDGRRILSVALEHSTLLCAYVAERPWQERMNSYRERLRHAEVEITESTSERSDGPPAEALLVRTTTSSHMIVAQSADEPAENQARSWLFVARLPD